MTVSAANAAPTVAQSRTCRRWLQPCLAAAGAAVIFGLLAVGLLALQFALPLIGCCLAFGVRECEASGVRPSVRNVVVIVAALLAHAVVLLLPAETVFLLSTLGEGPALALIAAAGVAAVAAPLVLRESELSSGRHYLLSRRSFVLASAGVAGVTAAHVTGGLALSMLVVALLLPVPLTLSRCWQLHRGLVEAGWWRHPRRRMSRPYLVAAVNVWLLTLVAAAAVTTGAFAPLVDGYGPAGRRAILIGYGLGLAVVAALALLPLRRIRPALQVTIAFSWLFIAGQIAWVHLPPIDPVEVPSPLTGSWYVVHGGRSGLVNGHQTAVAQGGALDLIRVVGGSSHHNTGAELDDYYAWHQPVVAPADGIVVTVSDDQPDQRIGAVDRSRPAGNHVVLQIADGRYLCFGHLGAGSIVVRVGQPVRAGERIGLVGNSGNSDEPHLHLQAQNSPVFDVIQPPKDLRTFPLLITDVTVTRDGNQLAAEPADLRRGDLVTAEPR